MIVTNGLGILLYRHTDFNYCTGKELALKHTTSHKTVRTCVTEQGELLQLFLQFYVCRLILIVPFISEIILRTRELQISSGLDQIGVKEGGEIARGG